MGHIYNCVKIYVYYFHNFFFWLCIIISCFLCLVAFVWKHAIVSFTFGGTAFCSGMQLRHMESYFLDTYFLRFVMANPKQSLELI